MAQPINIEKKADKKEKSEQLERQLSKSSIDNSPIFMIYARDVNVADKDKVRKSLWQFPVGSRTKLLWWLYTWPIRFLLTMTIPNPKTYRRLYPLTFLMCIIWIGTNAFLVVWMVTIIGTVSRLNILQIPTQKMPNNFDFNRKFFLLTFPFS